MSLVWDALQSLNNWLWHPVALYVVVATGVLFTLWSGFSQWRVMTHGVAVIRGRYDRDDHPGAVSHFKALSAAMSATIGLGNIGGVALSVSLGGPGAVFWMWVIGFVGMALKLTEVTQAMLFRDLRDPQNPSGGAMWVADRGFAMHFPRFAWLGRLLAVFFCITLLVGTITGGNMFQAWNVADLMREYYHVPAEVSGALMAILVALVILGGIRRIGTFAAFFVPFMCLFYVAAAMVLLALNVDRLPAMFALIVQHAFAPASAAGAFVGGTAFYAFSQGMQRALFSNEAGQGSAPIAHSAARTDEPVREGIVAGIEPFVDTLVICTVTALVILLSGSWSREPDLAFAGAPPRVEQDPGSGAWVVSEVRLGSSDSGPELRDGAPIFVVIAGEPDSETGSPQRRLAGTLRAPQPGDPPDAWRAVFEPQPFPAQPRIISPGVYHSYKAATFTAKSFDRLLPGLGMWVVPASACFFAISTIISYAYYGEQGLRYLTHGAGIVAYRWFYCALVYLGATAAIAAEAELDVMMSLGTGLMLWANIPIMLIFGAVAMRHYHEYCRKLAQGEFTADRSSAGR